jgi:hypothetical protein
MKKGLILVIAFIFASAMEISDKIVLTKENDPTDVKIVLNIDDSKKTMDEIVKQTAQNIKVLKKYCQKVTYEITPVKDKNATGFKAHIFAKCIFPNEKTKEFSNTFPKLKGIISIDSISFSIEPKKQAEIIKEMKIKAYKTVQLKEKELSKQTKLNCYANSIKMKCKKPKVTILQSQLPMSIEKLNTTLEVDYKVECF